MYTSLMYHETESKRTNKFSVELPQFVAQMKRLVGECISSYELGSNNLISNRHFCLLTFDDGHASNLQAAEVLAELGLKGYFFLIKDYSLERKEYLKENEIKEIASMGHYLGVHGKNHDQWPKIEEKKLICDLRETKDWIEQLSGRKVDACSAPGGNINKNTIALLRKEIPELTYIRTSRYGVNRTEDNVIKSVGVRGDYSIDKVLKLAKNDYWTMKKLMAYYYAKESIKPIYHLFKM